ncbi:hypothetical protein DFH27DRAFT_616902 [Peziza echinospora]|nr:hypothetical protein DFH27DRAFT_616902 [Peziza echinospora]
MRQDAGILLAPQTPALALVLQTLSQEYRAGANNEVHSIRVGAARKALVWIKVTPPHAVLARSGWEDEGAGVAHLTALTTAVRNLVPNWADKKTKIGQLMWDLRYKNFPGVYHDDLRARGWVMTRDDVDSAVTEFRKEVKTKLKKKVHGVKSKIARINNVTSTVTSKLDNVQSKIKDINTSVTTWLESVQSEVDTLKSRFASILAAIAATQPRH